LIDFWCFNATFSNISALSWRLVLVVEEAKRKKVKSTNNKRRTQQAKD
jgi:predicted component of type VI protein secretion system